MRILTKLELNCRAFYRYADVIMPLSIESEMRNQLGGWWTSMADGVDIYPTLAGSKYREKPELPTQAIEAAVSTFMAAQL